jgi:hypothetical protein
MRKTIIAAAIAVALPLAGGSLVACNSTWWQNFQSDPVQQVQTFEQSAQVVLSDAQVAWTLVQPFLPAANAAQINQQFQNAVAAVNHALVALNDGVQAAVEAQQSNPNFSALMSAVTDAIAQVLAIVHEYTQPTPAPVADGGAPAPAPATDGGAAPAAGAKLAPPSSAFSDAQSGLASIKKAYHLK